MFYLPADLSSSSDEEQPLRATLTRAAPIIVSPAEYCVAVVRAVLPASDCPMLIAPLLIGQTQYPPQQTMWTVTLTYGIYSATAPVELVRTRLDAPIPSVPLAAQPESLYAAIYDYNTILVMVNSALLTAMNSLRGAVGGTFPGFTTQPEAPLLSFDPATQLFSLTCLPFEAWNQFEAGNQTIALFVNQAFSGYWQGWTTTATAGGLFQVNIASNGSNWLDYSPETTAWLPPPGLPATPSRPRDPTTALLRMSQSYAATWCWQTALSSLQIVSDLPTTQEYASPPKSLGGFTPSNAFIGALVDFQPDLSLGPGAFSSPWYFNAASPLTARFVELQPAGPISSISFSVFWIDSSGVSRPVTTSSSQTSASIMLLFVKRSLLEGTGGLAAVSAKLAELELGGAGGSIQRSRR